MTPATSDAIKHQALIFAGMAEFLGTAVPFLDAGREAGEVLIAVVPEPRLSALRDMLGGAGEQIQYVNAAAFYRHPVRVIKDYDQIVRQSAPRRVRVVGELVWRSYRAADTQEWMRYEAVVNAAFARSGAQVICAYDTGSAPAHVVQSARHTHPLVISGPAQYPSPDYTEPEEFGTRLNRAPRIPAPEDAERLAFADEGDLRAIRGFVGDRAIRHGLGPEAVSALETAVTEVATNALRHGAPPMAVQVWTTPRELVCEVADHGFWRPGALIGFVPPASVLQPGFGLWTVRLLVDHVRVYAGWDGTFVRLHMHL